jgi:hypothetical protein
MRLLQAAVHSCGADQEARIMARSTRITIKTESLMICQVGTSTWSWCTRCAGEVEMIPLKTTPLLSNLLPHELEKWLNSRDLHRSQTTDGTELICLNSLLARMGSRQTK